MLEVAEIINTMEEKTIYLTKEGYNKLKTELEHLTKVKRKEVSERIARAKEFGDISENSEYDSARDEQSFLEGKVLEIKEILKRAKVIEGHDASAVYLGSKVKVEVDGELDEFVIVSPVEADPMEGKISYESPVGGALLGKKVGDVVEVASTVKATYRILEIN